MKERVLIACLAALPLTAAGGYVPVKGGALGAGVRVDDFEMLDHPVTNAEYKLFVDASKYTPPVHWVNGAVPAGMENWPVIFVNRTDVAAYTKWLAARDKRIYRLPTRSEFEYAARAGRPDAAYPWGNEPPESRANYDPSGKRNLGQWRQFLKPVKSYAPNPWGLYDMAGNVFQMADSYPDTTATGGYTFRAVNAWDREAGFAGGSWARTAVYLRCGDFRNSSSGLRTPELGFASSGNRPAPRTSTGNCAMWWRSPTAPAACWSAGRCSRASRPPVFTSTAVRGGMPPASGLPPHPSPIPQPSSTRPA